MDLTVPIREQTPEPDDFESIFCGSEENLNNSKYS